MLCIIFNPSSQHCPDYNLDVFELAPVPLVNNNTTHEQAATLLTNFWTSSNTAEKLLCQIQVDADEAEAEAAQQLQAEEEALGAAEAQKERDNLHQEECKKNQSKFLPIPD